MLVSTAVFAVDPYEYLVDLTKVVDDKVYVELKPPKIKKKEITFYLPKIVPGTYAIADYGRMVSDLKAVDKKGREIKVERLDENSWKIFNAKKLSKISYWVEDTYDTQQPGPGIFQPAGTNIEEGKNFVVNTSGFFGYFEGMKKQEFQIDFLRDKDFYGATGLKPLDNPPLVSSLSKEGVNANEAAIDRFSVDDYDRLIDSPLMYSKPDTAIVRVADADVLIASYSPNSMITAKEIATSIEEVLEAQKKYLGGRLPVDKYAFIFYFTDQPVTSYGALEHSYSSLYYMPERTIGQMKQQLRDFAAHEFFHIVTPLNIHSQEIENFDFNDPKMSQHLWLYEGMTEYFAGNVQVKHGLITQEQYLNIIRQKMLTASQFQDNLPFTELSKGALNTHADQYYNVYMKGALIGMALDIKLKKLSNGEYGTQALMAELSEKYGKNSAFKDDELFDTITEMTYSEIGEFFSRYVAGEESIPYAEFLKEVGVKLTDGQTYMTYDIGLENGNVNVANHEGKQYLVIQNDDRLNAMGKALGLKNGDLLQKINGEDIPSLDQIVAFIQKHVQKLPEIETLSYTVLRDNSSGGKKSVKLSTKPVQIEKVLPTTISFDPNATEEQLKLRKSWLEASK